ncbi:hypothetical protein PSHT_06916 [Puccinia striiformis]|uniref:Uncharacterized protein n=1 Tax=Puccinia striiformis TaxID=27350 RepID=A0A2S4W2J8_9BASI|nr:hypothetical protein PSHT_06916 [Puccinia striiformis]
MDMGEAELLAGPGNDDSRQRWVWSRRSAGPAVSPDPLNLHAPPNLTQVFSSPAGARIKRRPAGGTCASTASKAGSDGRIQVDIGCGHPIQTLPSESPTGSSSMAGRAFTIHSARNT